MEDPIRRDIGRAIQTIQEAENAVFEVVNELQAQEPWRLLFASFGDQLEKLRADAIRLAARDVRYLPALFSEIAADVRQIRGALVTMRGAR